MTLQFQPNRTSYWASRNIPVAITLLVTIQVIQVLIGLYLGRNALPVFSASAISFSSVLLAATLYFLQSFYERKIKTAAVNRRFNLIFQGNLLIFTATFAVSLLVGNQFARLHNPTVEPEIRAMVSEEITSQANADSLFREIRKSEQQTTEILQVASDEQDDGQRLGYVALFVLSLVLGYLGSYLACSLACSGYGLVSVFALLLTLGVVGGGIYFLLRAFRKGRIKRWREMDQVERKKEGKRYLITTLITVGAFIIFFLIAANS